MPMIAEMEEVGGGDTGFSVQLYRDDDTGRLVVRAINEDGYACTDIDLLDLLGWLSRLNLDGLSDDAVPRSLGAGIRPIGYEPGN